MQICLLQMLCKSACAANAVQICLLQMLQMLHYGQTRPHTAKHGLARPGTACLAWPHTRPPTASHGLARPRTACTASHGLTGPHTASHGLARPNEAPDTGEVSSGFLGLSFHCFSFFLLFLPNLGGKGGRRSMSQKLQGQLCLQVSRHTHGTSSLGGCGGPVKGCRGAVEFSVEF